MLPGAAAAAPASAAPTHAHPKAILNTHSGMTLPDQCVPTFPSLSHPHTRKDVFKHFSYPALHKMLTPQLSCASARLLYTHLCFVHKG